MKDSIRLDKFLATAGYGSRKEIKKLTRDGNVSVNGKPVRDSSIHVSQANNLVTVNGVNVIYREFVYLMLNKPGGYISATEDTRDATVLELVPAKYSHYELFPVGRLDKDTEGFLLLTNDGKLAHELLAPKKHVPKTYLAEVAGQVTETHQEAFSKGVILDDGYKTKPAELKILSAGNTSKIELVIHEGKYHQVKRMFAAFDLKVVCLKRIAMGGLPLDEALELGEIRELTDGELDLLKNGEL